MVINTSPCNKRSNIPPTHTHCMDYCNTFYMGLPLNTSSTQKLQLVCNAVVWAVMGMSRAAPNSSALWDAFFSGPIQDVWLWLKALHGWWFVFITLHIFIRIVIISLLVTSQIHLYSDRGVYKWIKFYCSCSLLT